MKIVRNVSWSKTAIILLVFTCAWLGKNLKSWKKNEVIKNDVVIYYAYLPASFIFHDLNFEFVKSLPENFEGTIWVNHTPDQKPVLKMTMGLALLWIPFFFLAHHVAHLTGASTLGYSWPYSLFILIAALSYLTIGLIALRRLLLRFFSDLTTAIVLTILVTGTNMMYYVVSEPGMSHVYNFSLITVFLLFTLKWLEKSTISNTIFLGFLGGLIVLIRPVNFLILIFPALIGIQTTDEFEERIFKSWKLILLAGLAALLALLPQLIYWKIQTGQFFYNSYGKESFHFLKPEILNGLFSFRKGWFVYTPVMIFSVGGIIWLKKTVHEFYVPVVIFLILYVYFVFSWWCWWYGGSFGARPMVDTYGILAIPFAVFVERILKSGRLQKISAMLIIVLFIFLNQFQMIQYRSSLLHWDSMTRKAYRGIFLRITWPEGYEEMIKTPDYDKAMNGEKEYP